VLNVTREVRMEFRKEQEPDEYSREAVASLRNQPDLPGCVTASYADLLFLREAVFSADRRFRYLLTVVWDERLPMVNFCMLNPSTADEQKNDPTVAKCITWAMKWGYGSLVVTNLFALRATDPRVMLAAADPGDDLANDAAIKLAAEASEIVVCAWGVNGVHRGRADNVCRMLAPHTGKLHALKVTIGEPHHPLYLSNDTKPFAYRRPA